MFVFAISGEYLEWKSIIYIYLAGEVVSADDSSTKFASGFVGPWLLHVVRIAAHPAFTAIL